MHTARALLSTALFAVLSCGPTVLPPPDAVFERTQLPFETGAAPSRVDIYLDGTTSMQGFATEGGGYGRAIQGLERGLNIAWPAPEKHAWKFGEQVKPIPGKSALLPALKKSFYEDPEVFKKTDIGTVIKAIHPDGLSVVATDLFEEDADISDTVSEFSSGIFGRGLSVAICGIKSEFDGTIYDVGPEKLHFRYSSGAHPEAFRPFYLIFIGQMNWLEGLSRILSTLPEFSEGNNVPQWVLLDSRIVDQPVQWSNINTHQGFSTHNLTRNREGAVKSNSVSPPFGIFTIPDRSAKDSSALRGNVQYERVPNTPAVNFARLGPARVLAKIWHQGTFATSEAGSALEASLHYVSGNSLGLIVNIDHKQLREADYVFQIRFVPSIDAYDLPRWCHEWNLDPSQFSAKTLTAETVGTKTQNIQALINDLWANAVQRYHPELGTLYVYVRN